MGSVEDHDVGEAILEKEVFALPAQVVEAGKQDLLEIAVRSVGDVIRVLATVSKPVSWKRSKQHRGLS